MVNSKMKNQQPEWRRNDASEDDDMDYLGVPPLTPSFFENDRARQPQPKVTVSIQVDPDVLTWYRAQGIGWERRMQAALRIYAEANKDNSQTGTKPAD
jgi:uncharacterized protein (DUF4415 family)